MGREDSDLQCGVAYNLGRNAPYAERIQFELPEGGTEDLDKSAVRSDRSADSG